MIIVKKLQLAAWKQPTTECMVEIEIDENRLAHQLGNKAWRNKSRSTRTVWGLITCKVRPTVKEIA
jgi:hypothetical protein